jgi:hypothetical protein
MRTISSGVAQRCAPTGFSRVLVAAISGLSVSGRAPMPASPPAACASSIPAARSFSP